MGVLKFWGRQSGFAAFAVSNLIMFVLSAWSTCVAAVGDPCAEGDECAPGEICAPGRIEGDPSFCTRSCNMERPCPDEYICEPRGGVSLCNTPIEYAGIGEACSPSCSEGLLCLDDGSDQYCSAACTLPGSCPSGFSCRPGALNACARITSAPSVGEPCTDETGCSGDYECLELPNRELRYCSYPCEEIRCPSFMECDGEGEAARCIHLPYTRTLGDECVSEAFDESTVGCDEPLTCERDGDRRRCTRDCSVDNPCPEGFGCVDRPDTRNLSIGRCMPGVEDDPGLAPFENPGGGLASGGMDSETNGVDEERLDDLPLGDPQGGMTNEAEGGCTGASFRSRGLLPLLLVILSILTLRPRRGDQYGIR